MSKFIIKKPIFHKIEHSLGKLYLPLYKKGQLSDSFH